MAITYSKLKKSNMWPFSLAGLKIEYQTEYQNEYQTNLFLIVREPNPKKGILLNPRFYRINYTFLESRIILVLEMVGPQRLLLVNFLYCFQWLDIKLSQVDPKINKNRLKWAILPSDLSSCTLHVKISSHCCNLP